MNMLVFDMRVFRNDGDFYASLAEEAEGGGSDNEVQNEAEFACTSFAVFSLSALFCLDSYFS